MSIRIYNTLSKKKEEFKTSSNEVKMYVCGPTTYYFIHLGNARPLVVFDTIRRYLMYKGYRVTYVQNFTDIDDKIIKRAAEEGIEPLELSKRYIDEYFRDAQALGVMPADVHPKASEHISEMIEMVDALLKKGAAYEAGGDVFFAIRQFSEYGKLSGRSLEEMMAGARIDVDPRKQDPLDFVLWKAAKPGEPAWDSPWGKGRPGWHLECSVMSIKYLGFGFDIHGGGSDLIFPHHENEIAQAESCVGKAPFARYWIHNGFVTVNEEKMSKSLGNFFIVRDLLQEWPPEVVRFFLLSTHYRSPLDFSLDSMKEAKKSYARLRNTLDLLGGVLDEKVESCAFRGQLSSEADAFRNRILDLVMEYEEAMDDDFNTAMALAALFKMGREINSYINRENSQLDDGDLHVLRLVRNIFVKLLGVLGLNPGEGRKLNDECGIKLREIIASLESISPDFLPEQLPSTPEELLKVLLDVREEARRQKNYRLADMVRENLRGIGIILEDTPRGVRWRLI